MYVLLHLKFLDTCLHLEHSPISNCVSALDEISGKEHGIYLNQLILVFESNQNSGKAKDVESD